MQQLQNQTLGQGNADQQAANLAFMEHNRPQANSFFGFPRPENQSRGNSFMRQRPGVFGIPEEQDQNFEENAFFNQDRRKIGLSGKSIQSGLGSVLGGLIPNLNSQATQEKKDP